MLENAFVVTDLDGTLLNSEREISAENRAALETLGRRSVIRVAATGRSLYSVRRVLVPGDPFDYVVFSSGAGIMDWREQALIHSAGLTYEEVRAAVSVLLDEQVNFMVHDPVPDNHFFASHQSRTDEATDFLQRCVLYRDFSRPFSGCGEFRQGASQVLAVVANDLWRLDRLRSRLEGLSVIRTTSPLDHRSLWIEVFPRGVNKAAACHFLTERLHIPRAATHALGNDYNDTELLEWAAQALVTANAATDLRQRFSTVASNDGHGFAEAIGTWDRLSAGGARV